MTTKEAFHASARFGLGPKPGELKQIAGDPRGWLIDQAVIPKTPKRISEDTSGMEYLNERMTREKEAKTKKEKLAIRQEMKGDMRKGFQEETGNRIIVQANSDQPFAERLVLFWSNHFTVAKKSFVVSSSLNSYEENAIRPHINGYFSDMLLAAIQHPAMLAYLDNNISVGPNSAFAKKKNKGLNENLAREILELHTLGVGGGYTQQDVIALAKIITGWSFDYREAENNGFVFRNHMHEPGDKVLLGKTFKEKGMREGVEALKMLANHPSTARFVATKLARHFVDDNPPESAVAALEESFLKSGGHLPIVMKTLIALPEAWANPLAKLKNPYEYLISTLRLISGDLEPGRAMHLIRALNFDVFNAPSPAGFDDFEEAWAAPDALMKRVELSYHLAQRLPKNIKPKQLGETAFGNNMSEQTRSVIELAPSPTDAMALLFASPEFQRR